MEAESRASGWYKVQMFDVPRSELAAYDAESGEWFVNGDNERFQDKHFSFIGKNMVMAPNGDLQIQRLKAYHVQGDEYGCIVFSSNSAEARRYGASQLGCEWNNVESCRRAKWADDYADSGAVPDDVMLENGWRYECGTCGKWFGKDSESQPEFRYGGAFCSKKCTDHHEKLYKDACGAAE